MNGSVYQGYRFGFSAQFGLATYFSLGEIPPPRFDGVQLTVVSSASKASVLQQELSSLLLKGVIEEVTLLLALSSLKRVGDLQALSVSEICMDFVPDLVKVTLRLRPGYVPKVLSAPFRSQVVTLHSFHPPPFTSGEDERLHMLRPVRALKIYVDRTNFWRKSCHIKTKNFSLGERRYFDGLRGAWSSFTSQHLGTFY